ncbi:MAG TPA: iron-containing redox enzyme family protein [Acidimicrobiales bacterium]|nr:iron-containing redox enzyme family protein [Acidimicrobiales bacterium]
MTMPYDGRSRSAPTYEPGALPPDEFEAEFCDTLIGALLASGITPGMPDGMTPEVARRYHATYLKYMSFFAWKFPSWLMSVASLCPYQDVRREIINDCVDEEVGDPDADGRCHIDLLYDEAEECGLSRQEIFETEPTPAIVTCINAWENLTRTTGWLPGFAAIAGLEITQSEPAKRARVRLTGIDDSQRYSEEMGGKTFHDRLGMPEDSLKFFSLHAYKDVFHGGGELALLVRYAFSRQLQTECLWAAKTSMQIMTVHANEVRRLARAAAGIGDPAPALATT